MRHAVWMCALFFCGACEDEAEPASVPASWRVVEEPPATAPAGEVLTLTIEVTDKDGEGVPDVPLHLEVTRGGGRVAEAVTGPDGRAAVAWTLGVAPVGNELLIHPQGTDLGTHVWITGTLAEPLSPETFGDVNGFLTDEGTRGSTEDLAFTADGRLVLGVPEGLLILDAEGNATRVELSGDPVEAPLGVAADADGTLWVADPKGPALRRVRDGVVDSLLVGQVTAPNYVALGPDGAVYVSDPCQGEVLRVDPASGSITARHPFDLATEGGPNGLAFGPDGRLWIATENTGLLCMHADRVDIQAPIAGLYALEVSEEGFGNWETIAAGIGLFADGLAFDAEDNLYVVVDTEANFRLEASEVRVLPRGGTELVPFLRATDRLFANLAFGQGTFGETTLYVALLTVPGFTPPEARGVERIDVGIAGRPLP